MSIFGKLYFWVVCLVNYLLCNYQHLIQLIRKENLIKRHIFEVTAASKSRANAKINPNFARAITGPILALF